MTAHHGSLVEGDAARRRNAAEGRRACARSSRRRRSSSASTSATSTSSARSVRRTGSRRCCSASADPATRIGGLPKGRVFPTIARRSGRVRGAAARGPPRRARRHRPARRAARRPGAADRRRDAPARDCDRGRSCSRWSGARGRIAISRAPDFDAVLTMTADGFSTQPRPPRGARPPRRGQRDRARTPRRAAAGADLRRRHSRRSPTTASSSSPSDTFVGTLNEDFAIESNAGDIFQLGNASWRILQVVGRHRPRGRRARRAADDPVLARRGAGAQRRAVEGGQRSARRRRRRTARPPKTRDARSLCDWFSDATRCSRRRRDTG